jgi:uncharacterized protein (DUF1015 family)
MADIAPLTPLRYDLARLPQGLGSVVAPPYDVISPAERETLAARDPHNIVRLILPDGEGDTKYANAASILARWRDEGALVRDDEPAFYRHDQTFVPPGAPAGAKAIRRRGFLALVRLVPFADRVVLPHERTLSGPKEDRLKLFRATRTNLSPGFMLYRDPAGALASALDDAKTLAEFTSPDGVQHELAKVHRPGALRAHHRYETALRYAGEVAQAHPHASPQAEHRFFMTFLVNGDDPELVVFPTHRHVHSLPSFSFDDLVRRAEGAFQVERLPLGVDADRIVGALAAAGKTGPSVAAAMRDGRAVLLTLRASDGKSDPTLARLATHTALAARPAVLRKTDVTVLHSGILEAILGITPEAQAAKTNLWYPQDARGALAELRAGKGDVLFLMNATPVADVRDVAEAGEVMPQKSTFFFPKIPTGLAIHTLDPAREVRSG